MPLPTARLYLCARCRAQVLICRRCDRGQRYCNRGCAREARGQRQREAAARYAASHRGRLTHAARAQRYRARCRNKVTHQGSRVRCADASIASMRPLDVLCVTVTLPGHCHFCGCTCDPRVRYRYLGRERSGKQP